MSLPQIFTLRGRRIPWLRIVAAGCLLAVSTIALTDHLTLSRLADQTRRNNPDVQLSVLVARMTDLERLADPDRHRPKPASQTELATARRLLEARITRLEEEQAAVVHTDDVRALQTRVTAIEAQREQERLALTTAPMVPRHASPPPRPLAPPFRVMGVELRGGERFLSFTPAMTASLASARLLHAGESERGWQLQALEPHAALFRVNGTAQRVALP
ncbi:hypothetical protein AA12717_0504 [Gluconacetobacter sacchari DSM 12717]|uniref:Uncharacterized protein n=2 Tax=Gluconacetobacter sacchari TaxID=92759 RepID=A0A7W4NSX4_9PROT|nr:hypothetical protein [Gluconacetobacter sacchari]MBB2162523.1 hypothetical protein [Gluconacetobacter sacchari]GBQ20229.1 hypothetical protein AA12717_0504 [Gluconacetobacter sacchari DSM 12717]